MGLVDPTIRLVGNFFGKGGNDPPYPYNKSMSRVCPILHYGGTLTKNILALNFLDNDSSIVNN